LFSSLLGSRFYRLLILGMFARMMDEEIAGKNDESNIAKARDAAAPGWKHRGRPGAPAELSRFAHPQPGWRADLCGPRHCRVSWQGGAAQVSQG